MKIITIIGARPQFIKAALVSGGLRRTLKTKLPLREIIIHTGQHYDYNMSGKFIEELGCRQPDYNLNVGSLSALQQVAAMMAKLENILKREKPNMVLVYGDTNSTLAGALAARLLHIPVAHVEAGLRSYDASMPEEINRVLADHISSVLFCPTLQAIKNLTREGITKNVYLVGDIMYELALRMVEFAQKKSRILRILDVKPQQYILVTLHRASNVDNRKNLLSIVSALGEVRRPIIFPLHPRTKKMLKKFGLLKRLLMKNHIKAIAPVGYLDMIMLEKHAAKILTDSGGVQKESYFFKVPCVTLRDTTEWIETLKHRWNVLAGADAKKIVSLAQESRKPGEHIKYYGDGRTSEKIISILKGKVAKL